ncbi:hypothetical protein D3C75_927640 [compost metagenome]
MDQQNRPRGQQLHIGLHLVLKEAKLVAVGGVQLAAQHIGGCLVRIEIKNGNGNEHYDHNTHDFAEQIISVHSFTPRNCRSSYCTKKTRSGKGKCWDSTGSAPGPPSFGTRKADRQTDSIVNASTAATYNIPATFQQFLQLILNFQHKKRMRSSLTGCIATSSSARSPGVSPLRPKLLYLTSAQPACSAGWR